MAGKRERISLKRTDKPNLLKRENFELEEEVYDVIEKAKEILDIGSSTETIVTTGEGVELEVEDYAKKLCEVDWRTFILKPLQRRQVDLATVTEKLKEIRNKQVVENVNPEIGNLQKKLLFNGLRGFDLKIVHESLSEDSYSWSHEQQFLSDEEMNKEDQCSEEFSKQKSFKGNLGVSFSGFGAKVGGGYTKTKKTNEQNLKRNSLKTTMAVFRKAVWCRKNLFNVKIGLDSDTKEYIRTNVDKPSFVSDFLGKFGTTVYSGLIKV